VPGAATVSVVTGCAKSLVALNRPPGAAAQVQRRVGATATAFPNASALHGERAARLPASRFGAALSTLTRCMSATRTAAVELRVVQSDVDPARLVTSQ